MVLFVPTHARDVLMRIKGRRMCASLTRRAAHDQSDSLVVPYDYVGDA